MLVRRFHTAKLDTGELSPQGFLVAKAYLTRTGVFKYRRADGTVVSELRHPDDVFRPESLATLKMAPITDDHPREFVNAENARQYTVGWISDKVEQAEDFVESMATIAAQNVIQKVFTGKSELSCGYHADVVEETGEFNGEKYDTRQRNITYNHVAVVDRGRAGPQVKLRLDANDATLDNYEGVLMEKEIIINGQVFKVSQEVFDAYEAERKEKSDGDLEKLKDENEKLKGKIKDLEEKMKDKKDKGEDDKEKEDSELLAENEKLKARLDALEGKQDNSDVIAAKVQARLKLEKVAASILDSEDVSDLSDNDIMKQAILKVQPKADLDDKSDVYIAARFDAIVEDHQLRDSRRYQLGKGAKGDKEIVDSATARLKAIEDAKEEWKQPLAFSRK